MTTAPLLYVCVRPQQGAAAAEFESFRAAARLDQTQLISLDLVRDPLPPDVFERYSGFFIGGSPFNVTDPESTKTEVQRRLEADVERIAAGEVSRGYPEDTGPVSVDLTTDGESDPLLGTLAHRFTALTAHKEGSARVPDGATLLATNDACPVQAYRVGERLYATQFHPEPTPRAFTERMAVYRDDGYFPANDYDTVAGRVLAASVTEPVRMIRAFARAFGPA